MTTIAYDGATIAADKLEMIGQAERMPVPVTKIMRCSIPRHLGPLPPPPGAQLVDRYHQPRQRVLVGFSGSLLHARALLLHYVEAPRVLGHPVTSVPSSDGETGSLMVIHLDGEQAKAVLVCCNGGISDITGKPMACGSGGDYAMGAMYAGIGAHRAVEIASQLDAFTGNKVESISIATALADPMGQFPFYLD